MINCEAISSLDPTSPSTTPKDDSDEPAPPFLTSILDHDTALSCSLYQKGLTWNRYYLQLLEHSGDGRFWIPVTIAMWLAPFAVHLSLKSFSRNLFLGLLLDLAVVGSLKLLVRRPRPVYNPKGMFLVASVDHWSFPSGHSTRVFLIATYCWLHLPLWKHIVSTFLTHSANIQAAQPIWQTSLAAVLALAFTVTVSAWALVTASSRVLLGRHYLLDVVTGCILGICQASFVYYSVPFPL